MSSVKRASLAELIRRVQSADPTLIDQLLPFVDSGVLWLLGRQQAADLAGLTYNVIRRWSEKGVVQPTIPTTDATQEFWSSDDIGRLSVVSQLYRLIGTGDTAPLSDAWELSSSHASEYFIYRVSEAWVVDLNRPVGDYIRIDGSTSSDVMRRADALILEN